MTNVIKIKKRKLAAIAIGASLCVLPFVETSANSHLADHIINNNAYAITDDLPGSSKPNCRKETCGVFALIDKSEQKMYVYLSGELQHTFTVSTGKLGHPTPNMDLRPGGPMYEKYTSTKYPEGDYQGMGNMPYAVFLKGDYAIHGTTPGNILKLGRKASHGCVRLHPDNARIFYELVSSVGKENTWVTVQP